MSEQHNLIFDDECKACYGSGREHPAKKNPGPCPECEGRGRVLTAVGKDLLEFACRWLVAYRREEFGSYVGAAGVPGVGGVAAGHGG